MDSFRERFMVDLLTEIHVNAIKGKVMDKLMNSSWKNRLSLLQIKDLKVGQCEESCINLIQDNSIESSVQDSLPYILNPHSLC